MHEAEARLGVTFPLAVAEMYLLFGHRLEIVSEQDHFQPLERLTLSAGVLWFAIENQGNYSWGVRVGGEAGDPPVVVDNPLVVPDLPWPPPAGLAYPTGLTASAFCLVAVLVETGVCRREGMYVAGLDVDLAAAGFFEVPLGRFCRMGYDESEGPSLEESVHVSTLGVAFDSDDVWVAPRDPNDLPLLQERLPRF